MEQLYTNLSTKFRLNYFSNPRAWNIYLGSKRALLYAEIWLKINEQLPIEVLASLRWRRIKKLIAHAYTYVPMYKELWETYGITPYDIQKEEDLQLLPVITKQIFRHYGKEKKNFMVKIPEWRIKKEVTSGSTGEPLDVFLDNVYATTRIALGNRIWRWADTDVTKHKLLCAPESAKQNYKNLIFLNPHFARREKEKYIKIIRAQGIHSIFGSPMMAFDFVKTITEDNTNDIMFHTAVLGGHAVAPGIRKYFKDYFGCEVYEFYASAETRMIGIECEEHKGLHIQEEGVLVEIVDNQWKPLPPGNVGKIVITTLNNEVMPLIRYSLDDIGVIIDKKCACGRTSRRMFVEGRTNEMLFAGDYGEAFSPAIFRDILDPYFEYFERYQFEQITTKSFILRIIPTRKYTVKTGEEIIKKIEKSIGYRIQCVISCVNNIPLSENGKHRYFISNLWEKNIPKNLLDIQDISKKFLIHNHSLEN